MAPGYDTGLRGQRRELHTLVVGMKLGTHCDAINVEFARTKTTILLHQLVDTWYVT